MPIGYTRWLVPILMAGTLGYAAEPQQSLRVGAAIRVGYVPSPSDNLTPGLIGFGLNAEFQMNDRWSMFGELSYLSNVGKSFMEPIAPPAAGQLPVSPNSSADSRKNSLLSLGIRTLARYSMGPNVQLQGGLLLGKSRFRHEYIAQYADAKWNYADTCNGTPTESQLTVSPVVGVNFAFDKDSALEFNVVGLSYKAISFQHTPGAALVSGDPGKPGSVLVYAGDGLRKNSRMMLAAELGYVFRF